jgi:transposase-like protein
MTAAAAANNNNNDQKTCSECSSVMKYAGRQYGLYSYRCTGCHHILHTDVPPPPSQGDDDDHDDRREKLN